MDIKLILRKTRGAIESFFNPTYSRCYRCGRPWGTAMHHTTNYTEGLGCFPLCQKCWGELSPKERLPFYKKLLLKWQKGEPKDHNGISWQQTWKEIEKAVLNGK